MIGIDRVERETFLDIWSSGRVSPTIWQTYLWVSTCRPSTQRQTSSIYAASQDLEEKFKIFLAIVSTMFLTISSKLASIRLAPPNAVPDHEQLNR